MKRFVCPRAAVAHARAQSGGNPVGFGAAFRAAVAAPKEQFFKSTGYAPPVWQPSERWMKYRAVRWLSDNLMCIAAYQLVLQLGVTAASYLLLRRGALTAESARASLEAWHYPFTNWMDETPAEETSTLDNVTNAVTARVTGDDATWADAFRIANALLPLQIVVLIATVPLFARVYHPVVDMIWPKAAAAKAAQAAAKQQAERAAAEAEKRRSTIKRASYVRQATRVRR